MTAIGIYKSALLPEIIDYCQTFLFSLFENASTACNPEQLIPQNEINLSFDQVINWLNRCLTAPLTQVSETSFRELDSELIEITSQLTQKINAATDSGITPATNPLAQHRLIDAIEKILISNCSLDTEELVSLIESNFRLSAAGFYQHLNRLCKSCLAPISAIDIEAPPKPDIHLAPDIALAITQANASSYSDTEAAIEEVKDFFESTIFTGTENAYFSTLCKKMYIPILNSVIKDPETFLEKKSKHPIREILKSIESIGVYSRNIDHPEQDTVLMDIADAINSFIQTSLTNSGATHKPLSKLNKLAKQCKKRIAPKPQPQEIIITSAKVTTNTKVTNITKLNTHPKLAASTNKLITTAKSTINTQHASNKSEKTKRILPIDTAVQPASQPQEQKVTEGLVKRYISAILAQSDISNSLSENLQKQWEVTLLFLGKVHGIDSNEWKNALKLIVELAKQTSIEAISVSKAKQVSSLFRFAGVKSEIITVRTLAPPVDAKYAAILKEGNWFDLDNNGAQIRCKLAGIIKQIGRYIFISRQGQKVFEVDFNGVTEAIDSGKLKPKNDVSLGNTLEDILSNIKNASAKDIEFNEFS